MDEDYIIKEIDLHTLSSKELQAFRRVAGPELEWCFHVDLEKDKIKGSIYAIGAWHNKKPVGLALGSIGDFGFFGKVLCLWVDENHRLRHIGSKLFSELTETLKNKKCRHLTFNYSDQLPTLPILEHILKKNHWEGSRTFIKRYKFDGFTFHPPWLDIPLNYQAGIEEFPWRDLKKSERAQIEHLFDQERFDRSVYPFGIDEQKIEPLNSLGLRDKDQIVGWMITHRIGSDTIRYSSLCILKEYLFRQNWIKLLVDSINLQRNSTVQWAIFEINMIQIETSWENFVTRKLASYSISITRDLQSWTSFEQQLNP